jgi:hypothetical protein
MCVKIICIWKVESEIFKKNSAIFNIISIQIFKIFNGYEIKFYIIKIYFDWQFLKVSNIISLPKLKNF